MFAAQILGEHTQVVAYAERWNDRIDELRRMVAAGTLVCPGCAQSLWLRTGSHRRRHFAHRSLTDCPLANQSAEVLEAKRQLFDWLESKYPGKVRYDSTMAGRDTMSPADVLVETEHNKAFLYWIFDRQQRNRTRFLKNSLGRHVHVHHLHTRAALNLTDEGELALTASQRDFTAVSDFDRACCDPREGHLHFLLPEEGRVRVYRGLHCVHVPHRFFWSAMEEAPWHQMRIVPATGELVFDADIERWIRRQKAMEAELERIAEAERIAEIERRRAAEAERLRLQASLRPASPLRAAAASPRGNPCDVGAGGQAGRVRETPEAASEYLLSQRLRCEDCGTVTTDWTSAKPQAGTCVCRVCTERRWTARQQNS